MKLRPVEWFAVECSARSRNDEMQRLPSRIGRSLGRPNTQLLCSDRESLALFLHCGCELRRSSGIRDLAGHAQFFAEVRLLHDIAYISSDTLTKFHRHDFRAEKANEAIEGELRIARLVD